MKPNMRFFKRASCWVLVVEGFLVSLFWAASRDSAWALNLLPFLLLALLPNLPGILVAYGLGLAAGGDMFHPVPNPHPVAAPVVSLVVSVLFWVVLFWNMAGRPIPGRVAEPEGQAAEKHSAGQ